MKFNVAYSDGTFEELEAADEQAALDMGYESSGEEPTSVTPVAPPPRPRVETPFTSYGRMVNEASARPQMVAPGGELVQAPAIGVFADPVSPTSMGAFSTTAPARLPAPAPVAARPAPVARPAEYRPGVAMGESMAHERAMRTPSLTIGQRAAQEERELVAAHEAEYQAYMESFNRQRAAEGNASSDGSLRDGSYPLSREGFAQTMAGFPVDGKFWMPAAMRPHDAHQSTLLQGVGKVYGDASRALARPLIEAIPGNEDGFSDLSLASRTRRNFETQAKIRDLREAEERGSAFTEGEEAFLDQNDPGLMRVTVEAVKGIPGMVDGVFTNPEERRQFLEGSAQDLLPSLAVGGLAAAGGKAVAARLGKSIGPAALKAKNVRKAFLGRVAPAEFVDGVMVKAAYTEADALAANARWLQMADGRKAVAELYEKALANPSIARELARETLGDGLADAFVETLGGYGRGETAGFVENFVSGLPLDAAPYLAINAGKRGVKRMREGAGLSGADLTAAIGSLELSPTMKNKDGVQVVPMGTQKAGSTATRPQVEAMMQRPDLKDRLHQVAALARNPETSGTRYRLGSEDARVNMGAEDLQAASYGGREGSQVVNGYNQPRKGYEYVKDGEDGAFRSVQVDRPVAHITGKAKDDPELRKAWVDGEVAKVPDYTGPEGHVDPKAGQDARQADATEGDLATGEEPETWWRKILRHYTDNMLDMKKMQERLKNKDANPYREYDLINGRTDHGIHEGQRSFIDPMLQIMQKHELTQDDVDDYLYARHAKKVNEHVRTIRDDNDAGSGMSDAEADAIMEKVNGDAVKRKAFEAIGELSNRMNRWRMDMEVKSGLRSEADALKLAKQYPDYVPLRGLPDAGADILPDWMLTTDKEHDARPDVVRGKTARTDNKKRMGRKSKAESVLAQNLQRTIDTIVNAQRNMAARELLKAAAANPDKMYWEINPKKTKEALEMVVDENGDKVVSRYDPRMSRLDKGIIPIWVDGKAHYLEMKSDEGIRFAEAIKGVGVESLGPILRKVNGLMRLWKAALTSKNPMFTTKNFIRDTLMSAMVSYSRDGGEVFRNTMRGVPGAALAVWLREAGHKSGWDHYIDLWEKEGGKIGFAQAVGFDRLADGIDSDLKDLGRSAYDPRKAFKRFVDGTELINSGIEAANRLAYFRALVDSGVDAKTAASKSKELTVNFNRRGNATLANTYKLFLNANIQGKMNLWDVATNPESRGRFWKVVAPTMATLGASSAALGMWLGGEDEESGRRMYDRLRPYEKSNCIVIMDPRGTGKYITLPLPYDIALPYQVGRLAFEAAMREGSDPTATRAQLAKDATLEIANVMLESFNPSASRIDPGDWVGSAVSIAMPSVARPFLEVNANKNFAGRPIYPENRPNGVEKAESELYYPGINPVFREVSDALARAGGKADKYHPGASITEFSPEKMEHLFNAYGGGMAKLFQQGVGLFGTISEDGLEGVESRQVPFWSDYGHAPGDRLDRQDFDEFLKADKASAMSYLDKARNTNVSKDDKRKDLEDNYASFISAKAFGALRGKEFKLQGIEDMVDDMEFGDGVKGEFKGFYAKAWKARKRMEALQDEHNASGDPEERERLRKRMEDELKKAFEGFGK